MKDLITEARELCERFETEEAPVSECVECISLEMKTKLLELCDALEKAEEQNKQLLHEVCKLACESVERDKALARLEAEVEGWAKAKQEGRLVVLPKGGGVANIIRAIKYKKDNKEKSTHDAR